MAQLAARHGAHPNMIAQWKAKARGGLADVFAHGERKKKSHEKDYYSRGRSGGPWALSHIHAFLDKMADGSTPGRPPKMDILFLGKPACNSHSLP